LNTSFGSVESRHGAGRQSPASELDTRHVGLDNRNWFRTQNITQPCSFSGLSWTDPRTHPLSRTQALRHS